MTVLKENEKIALYETMKRIRSFEQAVFKLTSEGLVQGSVHFCIGQEAIAAGVCHCLDDRDYIMSNHRGHGHLIAKGADLKKMMAELMGKKDGYCSGKGGTMHFVAPSIGMMGSNGIVGGGNPIAVGLGYACKNFEKERKVVSFFGDGAINTGSFHESLNLASVWGLPILFICENNQYAISASVDKTTSVRDLSQRAKAYGIMGEKVDGNDVYKVMESTRKCLDKIEQDKKPALLVCDTYRHMGHSIHDPRTYRTSKEEDKWKKRDPIKRLEKRLRSEKVLDDNKIKEIQQKIDAGIEDAVLFGKKSPGLRKEDLYKNIFF